MSAKPENKNILVTGGTGYIGVHTIVRLVSTGYYVTVVDNLVNSSAEGLDRVRHLTGCSEDQIRFFQVDITNESALREVFQNSPAFKCCIHFAGLKAVGESVAKPLLYYENNVGGTLTLLKLMDEFRCRSIVFSSSATVYGTPEQLPIKETALTGVGITNAYGRAKYMIEEILKDFKRAKDLNNPSVEDSWSMSILRYFNPVGAHPSGEIGEDPNGVPNNLMPYVAQVVVGRRDKLTIFGHDYETRDGTGVRDYIHVMDLAEGHLAALRYMENETSKGHGKLNVFNLGTGRGYSVLEMIEAMKRASGRPLPYEFGPRREGDIAESYADASLAHQELGWEATRGLDEMCKDLWEWQSKNPNGYRITK